jgi:hypothetical protein
MELEKYISLYNDGCNAQRHPRCAFYLALQYAQAHLLRAQGVLMHFNLSLLPPLSFSVIKFCIVVESI